MNERGRNYKTEALGATVIKIRPTLGVKDSSRFTRDAHIAVLTDS